MKGRGNMKRKAPFNSRQTKTAISCAKSFQVEDEIQLKNLSRVLTTLLAREKFKNSEANHAVLIQEHRWPVVHRSAQDVADCPYPENVKLVLFLRPVSFRTINRSVPDWAESDGGKFRVLCIDPIPGIFEALRAMLNWVNSKSDSSSSAS